MSHTLSQLQDQDLNQISSFSAQHLKKFCHRNYVESEHSSKAHLESFHRTWGGDRTIRIKSILVRELQVFSLLLSASDANCQEKFVFSSICVILLFGKISYSVCSPLSIFIILSSFFSPNFSVVKFPFVSFYTFYF